MSPLKGRKLTQEHKDKIGNARKGKTFSNVSRGLKEYYQTHEVWNKGIKHGEETKRRISETSKKVWEERKSKQQKKTL